MNQIESQLQSLRLHGMYKTFTALKETRQLGQLALNEGLELLLQAEAEKRDHRRFTRLKQNAAFRYQASIEELRMDPQRGVDKQLIYQLAPGDYIQKGESVLITGATGCGKSFLASALGHQACSQGFKVAYLTSRNLWSKPNSPAWMVRCLSSSKNWPRPICSSWMTLGSLTWINSNRST